MSIKCVPSNKVVVEVTVLDPWWSDPTPEEFYEKGKRLDHAIRSSSNIDNDEIDSYVNQEYVYKTSSKEEFEHLADAIESELGIDMPCTKDYTYRYRRQNEKYGYCGTVYEFRYVVEEAYKNPLNFTCTNLSEEEQKYIDLILELKIKETLVGSEKD